MALTEYHVPPQSVQAAAGPLTIVVHNYGRLSHNLVIAQDGHPQASTKAIPPGQTTDLFTTLPPGQYVMASTILADQALGAYGTLSHRRRSRRGACGFVAGVAAQGSSRRRRPRAAKHAASPAPA